MKLVGAVLMAAALAGCQENINAPGECPDLCPGDQIIVRDTIIPVTAGSDTTYFGFVPRSSRSSLLVSDGLSAGEYRSFVVFPKQRTDSITIDGVLQPYTIDTVAISFNLRLRDSTATGLTVFLHRIPLSTDTTITFAALQALIAANEPIDSIEVADSVRTGLIEAIFTGEEEMAKLAVPEDDSGQVAIALTVRASKPTGIALSVDPGASATAPKYENRGRIEIADTTRRRQVRAVQPADLNSYGWVSDIDLSRNPDPDLLYLGGPGGARVLVRFDIPKFILDSGQILRATLELTPAMVLNGLPNNPFGDSVAVRGILIDLGPKSPPLLTAGLSGAGGIGQGTADVVSIDFFRLATQWQVDGGPPPALFLAHADEFLGGGFMQPVFYSTRSPIGHPRLRLTYGLPTRPGRP